MAELRWLTAECAHGWDEFAALFTQWCREVVPGERSVGGHEWRARAAHVANGAARHDGLAVAGGEPAGVVTLEFDPVRAHSAWIPVLYVAPRFRRQGIGSTLLAAVGGVAAAAGRTRLRVRSVAGDPAGEAFALAAGGERGLVTEQNRCPTATLDRGLLRAWRDRAAERAGGYSLVAFDGVCPDEHLDAFTAVIPVMDTAPRVAGQEDWAPSPDQMRDIMASTVGSGTAIWTVCARHDATGAFVGYTELFLPRDRPWAAAQGDTGVHADHRERGIGRWLKAHNALRLLAERPDVEFIETWNAAVNAPMLSINRAMGFEVVSRRQEWDVPA